MRQTVLVEEVLYIYSCVNPTEKNTAEIEMERGGRERRKEGRQYEYDEYRYVVRTSKEERKIKIRSNRAASSTAAAAVPTRVYSERPTIAGRGRKFCEMCGMGRNAKRFLPRKFVTRESVL